MTDTAALFAGEEDSDKLVAYRLGRVEKAVEEFNRQAVARDEKLSTKLDDILNQKSTIEQTKYRVGQLENKLSSLYKYLTAVSVVLIGTVADAVIRSIQ